MWKTGGTLIHFRQLFDATSFACTFLPVVKT